MHTYSKAERWSERIHSNLINKGNPCREEQKKIDAFTFYSIQCLVLISFQSQTSAKMFCL